MLLRLRAQSPAPETPSLSRQHSPGPRGSAALGRPAAGTPRTPSPLSCTQREPGDSEDRVGQSECPPWAQPAPKQTAARGACRRPGAVTKGCHPTGPGGLRAEEHTAENSGTLASPPLLRVRPSPQPRTRLSTFYGKPGSPGRPPWTPLQRAHMHPSGKRGPSPLQGRPSLLCPSPQLPGSVWLSFKPLPCAPT